MAIHHYISDILVFASDDGHTYEFGYALARGGAGDTYCFEGPRVSGSTARAARTS
jgi:hypothetical protein